MIQTKSIYISKTTGKEVQVLISFFGIVHYKYVDSKRRYKVSNEEFLSKYYLEGGIL